MTSHDRFTSLATYYLNIMLIEANEFNSTDDSRGDTFYNHKPDTVQVYYTFKPVKTRK